ncbi:poly-gamma-glutamate synthase PgsB [Candidatus Marinimicrobia bacterium]|jgi:poly-gamma-glutamate synthase PgsB/CapB|nr:poly-gamma-glutamate synthase PgsB [Candidatus Neomarinimicrobiota bacterium]
MLISPLLILGFLATLLIIAGLLEFKYHQISLSGIPVRIHVNGTRGKSSVTRLIAAGLRAGGKRTFAKTTGTAPRVIDSKGIDRIIHRLRKPSIGEQVRLLKYFSDEKPDVVVMECMAVQPQYQWISEHQMVKSDIGVITNARPDHLDEMGPTEEDVVKSLCNSIPVSGVLVTAEQKHKNIIKKVTYDNNSDFILSDENSLSNEYINNFNYIEHPQNIAIALDVCEKLGVDRDTAIGGMHQVQPDLGALIVWKLIGQKGSLQFVNGMAANDPVSTLQIWKFVIDRYPTKSATAVFFNSRDDRPMRTKQMLELTFEEIRPEYLIVRGDKIEAKINKLKHHSPETIVIIFSIDEKADVVSKAILKLPDDSLIYAIGNQVGVGQEILEDLARNKSNG